MRWTMRRKANVIEAIEEGRIDEATALRQYELSREELAEWRRYYDPHGVTGLRATWTQRYRLADTKRRNGES
jgi:hypothetical protein